MHQKTFLATGTWVAIGLTTWTVAWVIAESIPVFNELLSLIVCSILIYYRASTKLLYRVPYSEAGLAVSRLLRLRLMRNRLLTENRRPPCHFLVHDEQGKVVLFN